MKTLTRVSLILVLAFFALGNRCCTTSDTALLPHGPNAAEPGPAKDEQIVALTAEVKENQHQHAAGDLRIASTPGQGTTVEATFPLAHPDRQPLGDLHGTLLAFLLAEGAPQLRYEHRVMRGPAASRTFRFDTAAIRAELGDVPLNHPAVVQWLAEFLAEGEAELS